MVEFILEDDTDLLYEEEVLRTPYEVKPWVRYLKHKHEASAVVRNVLYERALQRLPGSYKLWFAYLTERAKAVRRLCIDHEAYDAMNKVFERALVFMHKMPRIWVEYLRFLMPQQRVTRTRHAFDRALRSLPITQHNRVWPLYLKFVKIVALPELTLRVWRRYLKLEPHDVEGYIDTMIKYGRHDEAARRLAEALDDESFVSKRGKSRHELWMDLCAIISKHPDKVAAAELKVEPIIRQGIRRYTADVGKLWVALADHFIRLGHFEKARDVFMEAITTVTTVRDFSLAFDAYTKFEESLITARMEEAEEEGESDGDSQDDTSYEADLKLFDADADDLDLRIFRLERIMDRRPELVNSVLLRQNPHNVAEWHKRVDIFENDPVKVVLTYTEAVQTVNPARAKGKPHTLWIAYARYYESHGKLDSARATFEKAVTAPLRGIEDMAAVWCEWAEMELRHKHYAGALDLMRRAVSGWRRNADANAYDEGVPVQKRVHRSLRLWSMYIDLQESLGTVLETRDVYDEMIECKVVTAQHIINMAAMLEEAKYFEESYRAYEKGIRIFKFPHVKDIWSLYLTKFVARHGAKKLERARDLFEQAVEGVPAEHAKGLYLAYARLEEQYGLSRHAMAIYERATKVVAPTDRFDMYEMYLARATEFFGVTRTRSIYEAAIESVPDDRVADVCVRFAALERKLGEIDRARAIYQHMSQFCNPATKAEYWKVWNNFEVSHGNEETFRDMLRIKRNVQAQYTQGNYMAQSMVDTHKRSVVSDAEHMAKRQRVDDGAGAAAGGGGSSLQDQMQSLEREALGGRAGAAAASGEGTGVGGAGGARGAEDAEPYVEFAPTMNGSGGAAQSNPEEIDLDLDDDDEDDDGDGNQDKGGVGGAGMALEQQPVPAAVFGSLAAEVGATEAAEDAKDNAPQGALARFRRGGS